MSVKLRPVKHDTTQSKKDQTHTHTHTLWKLMLSLNGIAELITRLLLSQVTVLRQTGRSTMAMLNLSVSAAPLAVDRQYPITSKANRCLYCMNFHVKSAAHAMSHKKTTNIRLQWAWKKTTVAVSICRCRLYFIGIGIGLQVGWRSLDRPFLMAFICKLD
jgi:AhpD family alkylhydroperoxidase